MNLRLPPIRSIWYPSFAAAALFIAPLGVFLTVPAVTLAAPAVTLAAPAVTLAAPAVTLAAPAAGAVAQGGVAQEEDPGKTTGKAKKAADDKPKKGTEGAGKKDSPGKAKKEGEPSGGDSGGGKSGGKAASGDEDNTEADSAGTLSIDDEYVRENLQEFLHPDKVEWLPDGRVKMGFDFTKKDDAHDTIFTPKVSREANAKFRWTVAYEHGWWGGTSSVTRDTDNWYGGLRMGMDGQAILNCWFTDDVEAEISYAHYVNYDRKQMFALAYVNETGKAIGNCFGTQTATFNKGRMEKAKGTIDSIGFDKSMKHKLVIRGGSFEAHRDGRLKQKQEYVKKTFASGRLGFIWGGGVASIVHRLDITARVDSKKMAAIIRKATKK